MEMTAVDWLLEQIYYTDVKITRKLLKQAKEMEKQQIVKAAATAYKDMFGTDGTDYGEKYYNKLTQDDK